MGFFKRISTMASNLGCDGRAAGFPFTFMDVLLAIQHKNGLSLTPKGQIGPFSAVEEITFSNDDGSAGLGRLLPTPSEPVSGI